MSYYLSFILFLFLEAHAFFFASSQPTIFGVSLVVAVLSLNVWLIYCDPWFVLHTHSLWVNFSFFIKEDSFVHLIVVGTLWWCCRRYLEIYHILIFLTKFVIATIKSYEYPQATLQLCIGYSVFAAAYWTRDRYSLSLSLSFPQILY